MKNNNKSIHRFATTFIVGSDCMKLVSRFGVDAAFIIGSDCLKAFSGFGIHAIMSMYLTRSLNYSEATSTEIFHLFLVLNCFLSAFGAIIADNYLGRYKTIIYGSVICIVGKIILSTASFNIFVTFSQRELSILALAILAIGHALISPCIWPFGGDQFKLPEQQKSLDEFFTIFYFFINITAVFSTLLGAILSEDIKCLGQDTCYPLAFSVLSIFMVLYLVIFLIGTPTYTIKKPEKKANSSVILCILSALKNKLSYKKSLEVEKRDHWLQHADMKYDKKFVQDIRAFLNILRIFIPLPFYSMLYQQQGSTWIFQGSRMDGRLWNFYTLKPDQMQIVNPILIILLIPIFQKLLLPLLHKIGIKRPLQKMTIGGFLVALSYILCAIVETKIQGTIPKPLEPTEGQLWVFNSLEYNVKIHQMPDEDEPFLIKSLSFNKLIIRTTSEDIQVIQFEIFSSNDVPILWRGYLNIAPGESVSYAITENSNNEIKLESANKLDDLQKNRHGLAKIRVFYRCANNETSFIKFLDIKSSTIENILVTDNQFSNFIQLPAGRYDVYSKSGIVLNHLEISPGSISTLLIKEYNSNHSSRAELIQMIPGNSIHILWQLPQITVMAFGEMFFSVTGLQFTFTQAPESMKSVIMSAYIMTTTIGNILIVIFSELKFFNDQVYQFLLLAGLMFLDMMVFIGLSINYKYVENHTKDIDSSSNNHYIMPNDLVQ